MPRIARERGPDLVFRPGLDGKHHSVLVGERPAQDHEAGVDEPVHEARVRVPFGLLLHRSRGVVERAAAAQDDEERGHRRVLA